MKNKHFLCLLFVLAFIYSYARGFPLIQNKEKVGEEEILDKSKINDLHVLCKLWGFLKYYHPAITKGGIDWDAKLTSCITGYLETKSLQEKKCFLS